MGRHYPKNRFPFRIGTTSYIIPDDLLPNVRYLSNVVDDVELVIFESDAMSNLPARADVGELRRIGNSTNLTYTVHLPLDASLGSRDEAVRRDSVDKHLRVIDRMGPVSPFAWVIHFEGDFRGVVPSRDLPAWRDALHRSAERLSAQVDPKRFAVEFVGYPLAHVEPIVDALGMGYTLDIGHRVLARQPVGRWLRRYLDRASVVHAHGVVDGRDHRSLAELDERTLADTVQALADAGDGERVFTIEVFSRDDLSSSLEALGRIA